MTTLKCVVLAVVLAVVNAQNPPTGSGSPLTGGTAISGGQQTRVFSQTGGAPMTGQASAWNPSAYGAGPLSNPMGFMYQQTPPMGMQRYQSRYGGRQYQSQPRPRTQNNFNSMAPYWMMSGNDAMRNMFLMQSMMGGGQGGQNSMMPILAASGQLGENAFGLMAMQNMMGGRGGNRGGFNPALMYTMMNGGEIGNMLPWIVSGMGGRQQGGYGGQQQGGYGSQRSNTRSSFDQALPFLMMGGGI